MSMDNRLGKGSQRSYMSKTNAHGDESTGQSPAHGGYLRSRVLKRSIVVGRHRTSISLEDVFWNELREIAHRRGVHLSELVGQIDGERQHCNLSSAIRMFVFEQARGHVEPEQPTTAQAASTALGDGGPILNRTR